MNSSSANRPLVMVVEDDALIAMTLEMALESRDYRILGPAFTAVEAFELLKTATPDVALIDYRLATTTTEELLSSLTSRRIPVCILTGASEDELPPAYTHHIVLQKPFRLNALIDALNHARPN